MAVAIGDLLQIIDTQKYLDQEVLNVYYYRYVADPAGGAATYDEMLESFEGDVMEFVVEIQMDVCLHVSREIRNLTNGVDFAIRSDIVAGELPSGSNQALASFISAGFLLQRGSLATRNGYKRIGGLSEATVLGNDYVGDIGLINAIETAFAVPLTVETVACAIPIIVRRPIVVPVTTYLFSEVVSCSFRGIGTQNSRKQGRGV